jgi:hypothetical protein
MEYAVDVLSGMDDVPAREAQYGRVYRCPECKRPVVLKAARIPSSMAAHFAHVAHKANDECERYHPSSDNNRPAQRFKAPFRPTSRVSLPDLYLSCTNADWQLYASIPGARFYQPWEGTVQFLSGRGTNILTWQHLQLPQLIPVKPKAQPYVFTRHGQISDSYWTCLCAGVPGLDQAPNIFRKSITKGRRLGSTEEMVWGEVYYVVDNRSDYIPSTILRHMEKRGELLGYSVYELVLPIWEGRPVSSIAVEDWEPWLRHEIVAATVHCTLWSPLPHHFDVLGNMVLPIDEGTVYCSFSRVPERVDVVADDGLPVSFGLEDDRLIIDVREDVTISIFAECLLTLEFAVAQCGHYSPKGITVKIGNDEMALLSPESFALAERDVVHGSHEIELIFPSYLQPDVIRLNGDAFIQEQYSSLARNGCGYELNAQNFGFHRIPKRTSNTDHELPAGIRDRVRWLAALPHPASGEPRCSIALPITWANDALLGPLQQRSWGMKYIQHIRTVEHKMREAGNQ